MFLNKIPNEILFSILPSLDCNDLLSLALCDKNHYQLMLPLIYRDVEISDSSHGLFDITISRSPDRKIFKRKRSMLVGCQDLGVESPTKRKKVCSSVETDDSVQDLTKRKARNDLSLFKHVRILRISGVGLSATMKLENVTALSLKSHKMDAKFFQTLSSMNFLKKLEFIGCDFQAVNDGFPNAAILNLSFSRCALNDFCLQLILFGCFNLNGLILNECGGISDEAFSSLSNLQNLCHLEVAGNEGLSLELLRFTVGLPNLKTLILKKMNGFSDDIMCNYILKHQELCELNLEGCLPLALDLKVFNEIGSKLQNLKRLNLAKNSCIGHQEISHLVETPLKCLQSIFLGQLVQLTDETMLALGRSCENLKEIYLAGCKNITDQGMFSIIDHCKQLQILSVPGTSVTDETVFKAANSLSHCLKVAQFSFCHQISPFAVVKLAHFCKKLEIIQLVGCARILNSFITKFSQSCPTYLKNQYGDVYCGLRCPKIQELGLLHDTILQETDY